MALHGLINLLPSGLRAGVSHLQQQQALLRSFRAVADVEINLDDRETLKKYVGVRDHLSREPGTRSKLMATLNEVLDAVKVLPPTSDYRRGLEATCQYRLKVCEANEQETAIEDVLDSHMEEVIQECFDEIKLIPYMNENKPWDVPDDFNVPVFDYHDASEYLSQYQKK
ncbi:mitochondrial NADH:ubiquinone oxidoreductase 19-kd subunit variant A [Dunaliella salina]|uniref:Mitochondrial NADH:ubiquinone oxidoreductase 19-kd subunit variant A n=1 Tax=Dunaliella salina TaxID=3046 RepID=A0ABQ7H7S1_DUNSA|nr:mitochondrial NADH:ubiquinone oxidoreductase 19-kd subunit variant A [Dunaliella salina]|eukprot:KAF5842893.1 mitochondrial NADH:ubiquinone oxidoreductase 19-kd subunit variant A [Dunaliella salina]